MSDVSESTGGDNSTRRFEIEGKSLGFPSLFQDGCSAVGLFIVPSRAAQELIRDSGFELAELLPGRTALSLSCIHYRESDCGVYNEISLAFFVKPKHGRPSAIPYLGTWLDIARDDAATFVWKLPVTTRLANDAGVRMWGFPKTIEEIDFERCSATRSPPPESGTSPAAHPRSTPSTRERPMSPISSTNAATWV
ncbi:MAG: hypothetical protein JRG89_10435 [Deltaproteobacteria bacterium]|nr:hypothetical protein [Deltaproteobacteria bacterium]